MRARCQRTLCGMTNPHGRPGVLPVALAGWRTDSSRLWERDPLERDVCAQDEALVGRETITRHDVRFVLQSTPLCGTSMHAANGHCVV